jgi:hypothetical protein
MRRPIGRLRAKRAVLQAMAGKELTEGLLRKVQDQSLLRERHMDRYLIETPHTGAECLDLLKLINAQGYLWNFDWGCEAGVHSGWAIIHAENDAQARLAVPPLVRGRARIVSLNKFDAISITHYEKQEAAAAGSGAK